jgi:hypothetical protein
MFLTQAGRDSWLLRMTTLNLLYGNTYLEEMHHTDMIVEPLISESERRAHTLPPDWFYALDDLE